MAPDTGIGPQTATVALPAEAGTGEAVKANAGSPGGKPSAIKVIDIRLKQLEGLKYKPVDFSDQLTARDFPEPEPPSFTELIESAKTKVEVKYFIHHLVDGGVIALFVALAVVALDSLLSPVFLMGAVAGVAVFISDSLARKKALTAALKNANQYAERQLREFYERVEEARAEFVLSERNRVWEVRRLVGGNRDAVIDEVGLIIRSFAAPFPLSVTVEFYNNEPEVFIKFPTDEFIPRLKAGDGTEYPKAPGDIKRQYGGVVAAVTLNLAMAMLARIPYFTEVCANAYILNEENRAYILGLKIKRPQAEQVSFYNSGHEFLKALPSAYQPAADGGLAFVEPLQAAWRGTALSREIQKIQVACKLET